MKKFLVGLMSVFLLIGGSILSACTKSGGVIELSTQMVEIELIGGKGEARVIASVSGGDEIIEASCVGYENIIQATVNPLPTGKSEIVINAFRESENAKITLSANGCEDKDIHVKVFSYVSAISQRQGKENYLVKGKTNTLSDSKLLTFLPSANSRRDIRWTLPSPIEGVTLSDNEITISNTFSGKQITLRATNVLKSAESEGDDISCDVTLPVLDDISSLIDLKDLKVLVGYDSVGEIDYTDKEYYDIVSNNSQDPHYQLNAQITYNGNLKVEPIIESLDGRLDAGMLCVTENGKDGDGYIKYLIHSNRDYSSLNGTFSVKFKIGYEGYDYSVLLDDIIKVKVRETINEVSLKDKNDVQISNATIYTRYALGVYGEMVNIALAPTSVIDANYKCKIRVEVPKTSLSKFEGYGERGFSPVIIKYKDKENVLREISLSPADDSNGHAMEGVYETLEGLNLRTIYLVSAPLEEEWVSDVIITVISEDEPSAYSSFTATLNRAVDSFDGSLEVYDALTGETSTLDKDFAFIMNSNESNKVVKKQFKLIGQSSINGLHVRSNSEFVTIEDKIVLKSSGEERGVPYVIFEITASLNSSAFGETDKGGYEFYHDNGAVSGEGLLQKLILDVFLPLTDASIMYDANANSVMYALYSKLDVDQESLSSSLTKILLKNNSLSPISALFNRTATGKEASPDVKINFVDVNAEIENITLAELLLALDGEGDIYLDTTSNIIEILRDKNDANKIQAIKTNNVGKTFVIFTFNGKAENGEDRVIRRIVEVESFVSVDGLILNQEKDRNVTLYASDSISDEDASQTRKTIRIYFANSNITYADIQDNFEFVVTPSEDRRYLSIENKVISENRDYIQFDIVALTTGNNAIFNGNLEMHYKVLKGDDNQKVVDIWTTFNITILNAQRIENIVWKNSREGGLEYNVGQTTQQYLVFDVTPTNAKNSTLKYLPVDENGNAQSQENSFVKISEISSNQIAVGISTLNKIKGSLYVYPADMVHGGNIHYYYYDKTELVQKDGFVEVQNLGRIKSDGMTWFDYLTTQCYFLSYTIQTNANSPVSEEISFANIIKKINVIVVDGSDFEYSYRIYSAQDFKTIQANKFYTLKNSVEICVGDQIPQIQEFTGGLQGEDDVSITFSSGSLNLVKTLKGKIQNITLAGEVNGDGFVCDVNEGVISNVVVTNSTVYANALKTKGTYAGGIAGENKGEILSSSVLGLDITGTSSVIGGIVGKNGGTINGGKVEFYNVQVEEGVFKTNSFAGGKNAIIGGLVGEGETNSIIERSYAYDYTLKDYEAKNGVTAPFIGQISGDKGENPKVKYSFAVVGIVTERIENALPEGVTYEDIYNSYYQTSTYTYVKTPSNANFVGNGEDGYYAYVNNGHPHLKELYQEEATSTIDLPANDISKGEYKQVMVAGGNILLMHYALQDRVTPLTQTEQNDLDSLNAINLLKFGDGNLKITSSDDGILKVVGNELIVKQTGKVTLVFSSKQDAQKQISADVTVIPAFNGYNVSYESMEDVDDTTINIQRTKTGEFTANLVKTDVYLGNMATNYALVTPSVNYTSEILSGNVEIAQAGAVFTAITKKDSIQTKVKIEIEINGKKYLHADTSKTFTILPEEGAITIQFTKEEIAITPATKGQIKVIVKTTKSAEDCIIPTLFAQNEVPLTVSQENGKYTFSQMGRKILDVSIILLTPIAENNGIYTYSYSVIFDINDEYKSRVDEDENYTIIFTTSTHNQSDKVNITLSRQEFTSIDISNIAINNVIRKYDDGRYYDQYITGETTSTLAPGRSSVMQVSVNPAYAYYDYVKISYTGTNIVNAVGIEMLEKQGNNFVNASNVNFSQNTYIPSVENQQQIYFKLWINTTVEIDTTLCFKVAFYRNDEADPINYAHYYIDVNYLREPRITVDGEDTTFLAKGSEGEIKIEILANQNLDSLIVDGNVRGISIISTSDPVIDLQKGIKTYIATIRASLSAQVYNSTLSEWEDTGIFNLKATVRRTLNGVDETKFALATVVLVDFKIDEDNILIGESQDNGQVLTIWAGVPKQVSVNYGFVPKDYPLGEADSEEAKLLLTKRTQFLQAGYYPVDIDENGDYIPSASVNNSSYIINYRDKGIDVKDYQRLSIKERLFYIINGEEYSLDDENLSSRVIDVYESLNSNAITITGNVKAGTTLSMVLYTYVTANGLEKKIPTYFTIKIETFADEDLPLLITDVEDFLALAPQTGVNASEGERVKQDYILTSDIVLENYTPFDTTYISSLDGNGYTIYIKSFAMPEGSDLQVALFNEVTSSTLLKNIRVNVYEGGQLKVNTSQYKNIQVSGFAISNSGIITNCEVVAFYTDDIYGSQGLTYTNKLPSDKKAGINLFLTEGINTSEEKFITLNSNFAVSMAGFVITNSGSITNSRVGGESIYRLLDEEKVNGKNIGRTNAQEINLETFTMAGQGMMAGFVCNNSGWIGSSYAKNIDIQNKSRISSNSNGDLYLAGFVGVNNGQIVTSYIEGVTLAGEENETARQGSALKSQGIIAGFVYSNTSVINDSYSNIMISSEVNSADVMYASGFVYKNTGSITNGFSASQIKGSQFTQMHFSGVDVNGNVLTNGNYENCYFFIADENAYNDNYESATETQYSTGALMITDVTNISSFYGFAISFSKEDDSGIWRIIDGQVSLIEPDKISFSHRYILYTEGSAYEGATREDENGKYILPYSTVIVDKVGYNTSLGGELNPIIIKDTNDFINVFGESDSTYIKNYFEEGSIWGTYRLVQNIDLTNVTTLPSSTRAFSGRLYGNGFTIQGLKLASSSTNIVSYGLFKSLESVVKTSASIGYSKTFKPIITNLTLEIDGVVAGGVPLVGGIAGYAKDATIVGVNVEFKTNAEIVGDNFVGGIAGYVFGGGVIKNVVVTNPNVHAIYVSQSDKDSIVTGDNIKQFRANLAQLVNTTTFDNTIIQGHIRNKSYAGSAFGFVDIFNDSQEEFSYADFSTKNYHINNVKIRGDINAKAMVVGGAIALTGPQTHVNDISVIVSGSSKETNSSLYAMYGYAGGVIGQSFGGVSRIYAQHTQEVQSQIEREMYTYYSGSTSAERGILDLFVGDEDYTQEAIGGLIGYAGSGILQTSYSKLNVTSPSATYSGGVIGKIDSYVQYTAQPRINTGITTTYLIHEVYATGDVRSNTESGVTTGNKAGGIIGAIEKNNKFAPVSLLSVNAYNYFTSYDYKKGENVTLKVGGSNTLSPNFKINAFVGEVLKVDSAGSGDFKPVASGEIKDFASYITFEKGTGEGEYGKTRTTCSYYQNYNFSGTEFSINVLDGVNGVTLASDEDSPLYIITGPANFTTEESVHTQSGFLKSEIWLIENWKHLPNELFPQIQYRTTGGSMYLDCFNVKQVFSAMTYNNIRVIVRGKVRAGVDEYDHIDLRKIDDGWREVEGFYGTLLGGQFFNSKGEPITIISSKTFIRSTKEGFSVKNLTVRYKAEEGNEFVNVDNGPIGAGLFVSGSLSAATITNLTIEVANGIKFTNVASGNVGLVASTISNSNIDGIHIKNLEEGKYLMTVENTRGEIVALTSVGVVAGEISQTSTINVMSVANVEVDANKQNILSISGQVLNVGGMFGKVTRMVTEKESALVLKMLDISMSLNLPTETDAIHVTTLGNGRTGGAEGYIGGVIGLVENVTRLKLVSSSKQTGGVIYVANVMSSETAYIGGIVGELKNVEQFAISSANIDSKTTIGEFYSNNLYAGAGFGKISGGGSSEVHASITGSLTINSISTTGKVSTTKTLYAGGFAGQMSSASEGTFNLNGGSASYKLNVEQEGFTNVYAGGLIGINGGEETTASSTIQIEGLGDTDNYVAGKIHSKNANIGGLIGFSKADVVILPGNKFGKGNANSLTIYAHEVNWGGLVGRVDGNFTIESKAGGVIGNGVAVYTPDGDELSCLCLGGLVGYCEGSISINDKEDIENLLIYKGRITANEGACVGGMVGNQYDPKTKTTATFTSKYTSFAGEISSTVENSIGRNVNIGGVVGDTNIAPTINYSYNYGDISFSPVYKYNEVITPQTDYKFPNIGGIVGQAGKTVSAENNYSLVTFYSTKYSFANSNTVHTFVGNGSLTGDKNYYNHKVCLMADGQGTDVGYTTSYTTAYRGFKDSENTTILAGTKGVIYEKISAVEGTLSKGHKLNPITTCNSTSEETTNDITYYAFNDKTKDLSNGFSSVYSNNAFIYESNKAIKFTNNTSSQHGFINSLNSGFISGFIVDNDRKIEDATGDYGGLVGSVTSSIIYACQTRGSIEVGGKRVVKLSGLAGTCSGKIFDSSTDINLLYRAGLSSGCLNGLAYLSSAFVENCYTGGRLTTYTQANAYAIGDGFSSSISITRCYTYTRFDFKDYQGTKSTANFVNKTAVKYSKCQYNISDSEVNFGNDFPVGISYRTLIADNKAGDHWIQNRDFNYYYSVHNYGYLQNSSFAYIEKDVLDIYDIQQQGGSGFDSFVWKITYTRRENGYVPARTKEGEIEWKKEGEIKDSNNFYMIPNALVWNFAFDGDYSTNYILTNNIDWSKTFDSKTKQPLNPVSSSKIFTGVLDGQGYSISGLTRNLFESVEGKVVDKDKEYVRENTAGTTKIKFSINIKNASPLQGIYVYEKNAESAPFFGGMIFNLSLFDVNAQTPALAKTLTNAFVSNMTISGKISSKATTLGGLANTMTSGQVVCVTNLAMVNSSACENVGGLVGSMNTGGISYSSNYGPIYGTRTNSAAYPNAGGIVGTIVSGKNCIEYCYNDASVLCGYAKPGATALETLNTCYYAGGIVGSTSASVTINECVNSGLIISGNKHVAYLSRAAGILAFDTSGLVEDKENKYNATIKNCYNEGKIQVYGGNPTYSINANKGEDDKGKYVNITVTYEGNNVAAGGICASYFKKDNSNASKSQDDIILDGAYPTANFSYEYRIDTSTLSNPIPFMATSSMTLDVPSAMRGAGGYFESRMSSDFLYEDEHDVQVVAYDCNGLPMSMLLELKYQLEITLGIDMWDSSDPVNDESATQKSATVFSTSDVKSAYILINNINPSTWYTTTGKNKMLQDCNYAEKEDKDVNEQISKTFTAKSRIDKLLIAGQRYAVIEGVVSTTNIVDKVVSTTGEETNITLSSNSENLKGIIMNGNAYVSQLKTGYKILTTIYGNKYSLYNLNNEYGQPLSCAVRDANVLGRITGTLTLDNASIFGNIPVTRDNKSDNNVKIYGFAVGDSNQDIKWTFDTNVDIFGVAMAGNGVVARDADKVKGGNITIIASEANNQGVLKAGNSNVSDKSSLSINDSANAEYIKKNGVDLIKADSGNVTFQNSTDEKQTSFGISGGIFMRNNKDEIIEVQTLQYGFSMRKNTSVKITGSGEVETVFTEVSTFKGQDAYLLKSGDTVLATIKAGVFVDAYATKDDGNKQFESTLQTKLKEFAGKCFDNYYFTDMNILSSINPK